MPFAPGEFGGRGEGEERRRFDFGGRGGFPFPSGGFGGDGGDRGGFSGFSREATFSPAGPSAGGSTAPAVSGPKNLIPLKPKERVTVDLPQAFAEGDLDLDGQIGLYEWRQWRRGAMEEFLALDHNGDGFLTPAELKKGAQGVPGAQPAVASGSTPSPSGSSSAVVMSRPVPSAGATSNPGDGIVQAVSSATATDPDVASRQASNMFSMLDANHDGSISPEEWKRSSKLRPQFEAAGVDLSAPMSRDAFVQHYLRVTSKDS